MKNLAVLLFMAIGLFAVRYKIIEKIRNKERPIFVTVTSAPPFINQQNELKVFIKGTCSENNSYVQIDGGTFHRSMCREGKWSANLDMEHADQGDIELKITHVGADGLEAPPVIHNLAKDTEAPLITLTSPTLSQDNSLYSGAQKIILAGGCSGNDANVQARGKIKAETKCHQGQFSLGIDLRSFPGQSIPLVIDHTDKAQNRAKALKITIKVFAFSAQLMGPRQARLAWGPKVPQGHTTYLVKSTGAPIDFVPKNGVDYPHQSDLVPGLQMLKVERGLYLDRQIDPGKQVYYQLYYRDENKHYHLIGSTKLQSESVIKGPHRVFGLQWYLGEEGKDCVQTCLQKGGVDPQFESFTLKGGEKNASTSSLPLPGERQVLFAPKKGHPWAVFGTADAKTIFSSLGIRAIRPKTLRPMASLAIVPVRFNQSYPLRAEGIYATIIK